ncbi:fibrinogen-like protein 1 [Drosophila sulfurigaster albostrigata]|uniref:fibrinogen-like protein 1 n=1 Tax=Drosophila sulfurigaster albostrigata TaxID=89887 RepID=UPI002D21DBFC|nr:fibrinogen-like protein 1 [Drosophila sulfurigaster albostrigata]XP_062135333.1 fibrinogen-like protein 1 [Drosophila sulfurigaster albostrigata]
MCKIKINAAVFLIVLKMFLVATSAFEETCEFDREMEKKCRIHYYKTVKPLLDYFRQVRNELEDKEIKENKLNELNSDLMEKYHEIVRIHEKFMKEATLLDEYKNKVLKGENDLQLSQNKVEKLESKIKSQKQIIDKLTPISKLYDKCKKEVADKTSSLESSEVQLKQLNFSLLEKDENIRRLNANIEKITEQQQTLKLHLDESQNMSIKKNKDNQICRPEIDTLNKTLPNIVIPTNCSPFGDYPGVHQVNVSGVGLFDVLCDSQLAGPGWIVIQQRVGGNEDFNRDWATYRKGFGSFESDFFLGLEKIHRITSLKRTELFIHLVDVYKTVYFARYDDFKISDEDNGYALSLGTFSGAFILDGMRSSENIKFTTFDRNNDSARNNCAAQYESGWWYNNCYYCNLNAPYGPNLHWLGTTMSDMKLKEVKMLIRPERSDEEVIN